jgi:hypothetical protein
VDHLTVDVSRVHIPAVPEEHAAVRGALHLVRSRRRGLRDSGGVCGQQLGRRGAPKGGHHDVTERQAHGSQPVRVRSGETPGSPVAALPASGEIPGSRRGKTAPVRGGQPTGPQHEAKPAASLRITAQAAKREPSLYSDGEGQGRHLGAWSGCQGTLRRRGRGTVGRLSWELERPRWPRACGVREAVPAYNRRGPGSGGRSPGSRRGS